MSSPFDKLPLSHRLPIVRTGGICNQRFHNLVSGEVALGAVMMLGIGFLILQGKTNLLVAAGLNVGHVSRSEDKKRITLLGVEREYCLPDVALCWILNLLVAANIQCTVHRLSLRRCGGRRGLSAATGEGGNHDNRK